VLRYIASASERRRLERENVRQRDELIASLRLRLPEGAEFARLEHQMFFYDERNRQAAERVFLANGFDVRSTETYEKRTKFWLLAVRAAMIDRVPEECGKVIEFSRSYSGRYVRCASQL
jgi:hypothetical protein